jgi:hypothetical protein
MAPSVRSSLLLIDPSTLGATVCRVAERSGTQRQPACSAADQTGPLVCRRQDQERRVMPRRCEEREPPSLGGGAAERSEDATRLGGGRPDVERRRARRVAV